MTVWGGSLGMRRGLRDVKLARVRSLSSLVCLATCDVRVGFGACYIALIAFRSVLALRRS